MLDLLIPDVYAQSIYTINYKSCIRKNRRNKNLEHKNKNIKEVDC